jgi:hypothetical protein
MHHESDTHVHQRQTTKQAASRLVGCAAIESVKNSPARQAVLEDWSATRSSRIAVTILVPLGIVLATAGDVIGAWK